MNLENIILNLPILKMYETESSKLFEKMKLPEFLNTSAKWSSVVEYIDTAEKFDEIALKILDDDDIDIFEFRDIIIKLGNDVKYHRPEDGEFITMLTDTVVEMLNYLTVKSQEQFTLLMNKMNELDVDF